MTDETVDLDAHRGMKSQKSTQARRRTEAVRADQAALHAQRTELEGLLLAESAESWPAAAVKIRYLLRLFAATTDAQDPRRQRLIADTLSDIDRLEAAGRIPS